MVPGLYLEQALRNTVVSNGVCLDVYKNLTPLNNVPLVPRSDLISWHALSDRLKQKVYQISVTVFCDNATVTKKKVRPTVVAHSVQ